MYINPESDTRTETERLFNALAVDGKVEMPLQEMFWGGYFGSLVDQFGANGMFNCTSRI
jgi:PhnB protein